MIAKRRDAVQTIAREVKRLEELAGQIGEEFLAFLLANAQQEAERIFNAAEGRGLLR